MLNRILLFLHCDDLGTFINVSKLKISKLCVRNELILPIRCGNRVLHLLCGSSLQNLCCDLCYD